MKIRFLVVLLTIIFLTSTLSAYNLGFGYSYVSTTSNPAYMPYQYASAYDQVFLRYSVFSSGFTTPVNVVVSPRVYGVNHFGQRSLVHSIPTHSFVVFPQNPYVYNYYTYNPMFYFNPNYQFYEIELNLQSNDGSIQQTTTSNVYYTGSGFQGDPPQTTPTCDDFYLSGFSNIFLDEDKRDFYNLYVINTIDHPLTITSVTTNPINPTNLEIENITYPLTISGYQTRSAVLDLFADSVSSNYNGSFNIEVVGNYGSSLTCSKTYNVNYRINKKDLPNNSNCNDIRFSNTFLTIDSNDKKIFDIEIENKSLSYYFEVDDIKIENFNSSLIDVSIKNNIYTISEDSKQTLKLEVESGQTNSYASQTIILNIDGYYKRDNREDRRCRINRSINIRVLPTPTQASLNKCDEIEIFTRNLSLNENVQESFSRENGFFIYNNSNQKFTITGVNFYENNPYFNFQSKPLIYEIFPMSDVSLNFDILTKEIPSNISSNAKISIQGNFEDGSSCNYQNINSEFNVSVSKKENLCFNVGFNDSYFKDGRNHFTVYNNTDYDFTINDVIFQNRKNTFVSFPSKVLTIPSKSTRSLPVNTSNPGSFELLFKGNFSNGLSCDYLETRSGFFRFYEDYSFSDTCNFHFDYTPEKFISKDVEYLNFNFNNLTNKSGSIRIESFGAVITPSYISFGGHDNFNQSIALSNMKNPRSVTYKVDLAGCEPKYFATMLNPVISTFENIFISSYVSSIKTKDRRVVSNFTLKNDNNDFKEVTVRFSGFSSDFVFVRSENILDVRNFSHLDDKGTFILPPNGSKNINFGVIVPENAKDFKYTGSLDVFYMEKLISSKPFTIDRDVLIEKVLVSSSFEKDDIEKTVLLSFVFENKTDVEKNIEVIFKNSDLNFEGDTYIILPPEAEVFKSFKIYYTDLRDIEYSIFDIDENKVIKEGFLSLEESRKTPSILTGFLSLASIGNILLFILFCALVVLVVYFYRKSKKVDGNKQVVEKPVFSEDLEIKKEDVEVISKTKQITFKDLEKLENKGQ